MNQRDMRKRQDMIPLRSDSKLMTCTEILSIGWTEEHCQCLESLMTIDFAFTASRKERQRCENNHTLRVDGPGPKPGPVKERTDYPQAVNKVLVMRRQVENLNSFRRLAGIISLLFLSPSFAYRK